MKLRLITCTRGESRYWPEAAASVVTAAAAAEHVVVCPETRIAAVASVGLKQPPLPQRIPGLYPKLNQGLAHPGDWDVFTWINDDDRLEAPGFARLIAVLDAAPDVDVAYGRVDLMDGEGRRIAACPVAHEGRDLAALFARGIIPFAQPGTLIRRRVVERLGGLDEGYRVVGDMDFFVRAVAGGMRFAFVDELVASFRLNAGQLSKRPEVAAETERALRPLASVPASWPALARFRLANWRVYLERIRRHGWVSMRELYDRTE